MRFSESRPGSWRVEAAPEDLGLVGDWYRSGSPRAVGFERLDGDVEPLSNARVRRLLSLGWVVDGHFGVKCFEGPAHGRTLREPVGEFEGEMASRVVRASWEAEFGDCDRVEADWSGRVAYVEVDGWEGAGWARFRVDCRPEGRVLMVAREGESVSWPVDVGGAEDFADRLIEAVRG